MFLRTPLSFEILIMLVDEENDNTIVINNYSRVSSSMAHVVFLY